MAILSHFVSRLHTKLFFMSKYLTYFVVVLYLYAEGLG